MRFRPSLEKLADVADEPPVFPWTRTIVQRQTRGPFPTCCIGGGRGALTPLSPALCPLGASAKPGFQIHPAGLLSGPSSPDAVSIRPRTPKAYVCGVARQEQPATSS